MPSPYSLDQLPLEVSSVFRVTTYQLKTGAFTGVTLDFVLDHALQANYFVMFHPSADTTGAVAPSQYGVRVLRDPFGGFGQAATGQASTIRLSRGGNAVNWVGSFTVVECLQPGSTSGFKLAGTMNLALGSFAGPGTQQIDFGTAIGSILQVTPIGGLWGGGIDTTAAATDRHPTVLTRLTWSGTTLRVRRWGGAPNLLEAANLSVFLVQWGSDWTIQRADIVTGAPVGGPDLDSAGEFTTAAITPVLRARSWLFTSGGISPGTSPGAQFVMTTLGTGVSTSATESTVAAGAWTGTNFEVTAFVLTHAKLSSQWSRIASDNTMAAQLVVGRTPRVTEGYRSGTTVQMASGARAVVVTSATEDPGAGQYAESLLWPAITSSLQLVVSRRDDNAATDVTAWVQEVDFGFIQLSSSPSSTPGPQQYLIVPDLELTAEAISSITSEGGVRVGPVIPATGNAGRLFAFHAGDPTSAPVLTYRLAGHGDLGEAGWVWQVEGATYWYGWNAYDFLWGSHSWNDQTAARYNVCGVYSSVFGRLLVGYSPAATSSVFVRSHSEEDDDPYSSIALGTPNRTTTYTTAVTDDNALVRMIELDDGSLLMLSLVTSGGDWDWDVWGSQDGGTSWTLVASRLVATANAGTGLTTRPVSVAFASSGDWVRIAWVDTAVTVFTLVSSSRALSWSYLGSGTTPITTGTNGEVSDLYALAMAGRNDGAGTFILWIRDAANNYEVDAYTVTRDEEWVQDLDLDFSMGVDHEVKHLAACTSPEGFFLYAVVDNVTATLLTFHGRVYDLDDPQGIQRTLSTSSIPFYGMEKRPQHLQLVNTGRELVMVGSFLDWAGAVASTGVLVGRLAGWSQVPVQGQNTDGWVATNHWLCLGGQPNSSTYSFMPLRSSGGPTIGCTDLRLQVTTTSGYGYWEWTPGSLPWRSYGMAFGAMVRVPSSATPTADRNVGVRVTTAPSGPTGVNFMVNATTTMISLWDNTGGSTMVGFVSTPAITQYLHEFRVGLDPSYKVFMAVRPFEAVKGWKTREEGWTRISGTLGGSAGTTMDLIQWGNLDYSGAGTNTSEWREAWAAGGSTTEPGHVLQKTGLTWSDYQGRRTTTRSQRVYAGIDVFWGGGGGGRRDTFTGEVALANPAESIFVDSPRFYWEAAGSTSQALIMDFGAGGSTRRSLHEAAALFGSRCRTATIEYHWQNEWSSPLFTYAADATLVSAMAIRAVDGHAVLVKFDSTSLVPPAASWEGAYFRVTAGTTTAPVGKTWKVRKHGPARDADSIWLYLESTVNTLDLQTYGAMAGDTACVFSNRMAVRYGEPVRTRWMRVVLPSEDVEGGKHALGALVAGPVHDFDPPLDWSWKDNQQPNTTRFTSKSGVTWAYSEGPAQRVWQGRLVGDVSQRSREALRGMLRLFSSFDVRPVALVVDHANLPSQLLYGYVSTGGQLDNEGWFTDTTGKWQGAGDSPFQLVEVT
jgi:hypothetical protein